ncbi:MAG: alpha/beta fold hydrolase [Candidatus Tectomicrobia bacterium]|uniref:Alpha/beta fold hydrolase n=1 Tax=Tectimicrobiota bacterium TaxID=2528274 RepID=A0A932I276_UNCTE|nr:alpha/beta fold hydrolase [Candidatus Tectomicrobia bacterium]
MPVAAARKASPAIEAKEHFIPSLDKGITVHLWEKRPRGKRRFGPEAALLLVHGRVAPGPVAFDLKVPGYSWMDFIASRGFDVFTLSVRGFGKSTWPKVMREDPAGKPPAIRGKEAVRDIAAAVRFICERREVDRVNILGRSWGTTLSPLFATQEPARVGKLVLYAPYYAFDDPRRRAAFEDPARPGRFDARRGAWMWNTRENMERRWWGHISGTAHHKWREPRVVDAYWKSLLANDPEGAKRRPPAQRLPNGSLADLYDRASNVPLYDAAKVRCPVLLIRGTQDGASADPEALGLFHALRNSWGKRYVILEDGTHFMELEKRRMELLNEVQHFLEE